jgi:hypothetical protein
MTRRATVVKGFKNSQKIRIIVNGVGLYTTVGDTDSIFSTTSHRQAVQHTLNLMVAEKCGGISHTVTMYDHKLNRSQVECQVDLL